MGCVLCRVLGWRDVARNVPLMTQHRCGADECLWVIAGGDLAEHASREALRAEGWDVRRCRSAWEPVCPDHSVRAVAGRKRSACYDAVAAVLEANADEWVLLRRDAERGTEYNIARALELRDPRFETRTVRDGGRLVVHGRYVSAAVVA